MSMIQNSQTVSDSPVANKAKRLPGRPRAFDPDVALDAAAQHFWRDGFDATDVGGIAAAIGITKPSLYRLFGDKRALFLRALERYAQTHGSPAIVAFDDAATIEAAVAAFLTAAISTQTGEAEPAGCLLACVASTQAGSDADVREFYRLALAATSDALSLRFESAKASDQLPSTFPSQARARLMVDLMQALALRARAGWVRQDLLDDVEPYAQLILSSKFLPA
jgi:AcrR family transcriptional regulator